MKSIRHGRPKGIWWGKRHENGIWLASTPRRRLILPFGPQPHDSVYVAFRHLRVRIVVHDTMDERSHDRNREAERMVLP